MKKYGGFDRRLHRKFVRGRIKLPAIYQDDAPSGPLTRILSSLGLRRTAA